MNRVLRRWAGCFNTKSSNKIFHRPEPHTFEKLHSTTGSFQATAHLNFSKLLFASDEKSNSACSSLHGQSEHSIQESYPFSRQHGFILHKLAQKYEILLFALQPSQITYSGLTSVRYRLANCSATFSNSSRLPDCVAM